MGNQAERRDGRHVAGQRPVGDLGSALGGIRTPNLLIRSLAECVFGRPLTSGITRITPGRDDGGHGRRPPTYAGNRPGWLYLWLYLEQSDSSSGAGDERPTRRRFLGCCLARFDSESAGADHLPGRGRRSEPRPVPGPCSGPAVQVGQLMAAQWHKWPPIRPSRGPQPAPGQGVVGRRGACRRRRPNRGAARPGRVVAVHASVVTALFLARRSMRERLVADPALFPRGLGF